MLSKREVNELGVILADNFIGRTRPGVVVSRDVCVGDRVLPFLMLEGECAVAVMVRGAVGDCELEGGDVKRARKMGEALADYDVVAGRPLRVDMCLVSFYDGDGATVAYVQGLYRCEVEGDE